MSLSPLVSRISDYVDRNTGQTAAANGNASEASFSANGLLVAFTSTANNIASPYLWGGTAEVDDDGSYPDVYFHMLNGGDNTLLSGEQNGIFDVRLAAGVQHPASSHSAVFSPVSAQPPWALPDGSVQWLAFVTDSAGGHWVDSDPRTLVIPESDGSKDIAIAAIYYNQNGAVDQASSHTFGFNFGGLAAYGVHVVEESADVTGTPAFSGNGRWLGYAAGDPAQADFDGYQLRLLEVQRPLDGSTLLLRADAPIGNVALSQDGRWVAFDSRANDFDLDGDGQFDIQGIGGDSHRNVFVYDRIGQTVTRLTADSSASPAQQTGAHVAAFLADPTGSLGPTLLVDSVADPATSAPLPRSQTQLYHLTAGTWTGQILSTTLLGTPAGTTPRGTLAAGLEMPTGAVWAAMLSSESDLPGAPPASQAAPQQGWLGGRGLAPRLVTPGDPASGIDGANQAIESLALSPVAVAAGDVSFLGGLAPGAATPLLAYATRATNLLGATPTSGGHSSLYVATFDAPVTPPPPPPPPPAALDYTPGSLLNPVQQGLAAVQRIMLDATQDLIIEFDASQVASTTSISARLGRPYQADEALTVISPPPGDLVLAGGDDMLVGLPIDGRVDGGAGVDTLQIPLGTTADAYLGTQTLVNLERLVFDPAALPGDATEAWLTAPAGLLPVASVTGSAGVDLLRVAIATPHAGHAVLDLRAVSFVGWDSQAGGDLLHVDTYTAGSVEVHANAGTPMSFFGSAQATVYGSDGADDIRGGELNDRVESGPGADFLLGGPGADTLDGGPGRDMASWAGVWASIARPAPVFVDLADGLPERGGGAEGDVLFGIEDLWGSPDDDELLGDTQDNQLDGYDGDDRIDGRDGADVLFGSQGNDTLTGGGGDDTVHGGPGIDMAVWAGRRADFAVTETGFGPGSARVVDLRSGSPEGSDLSHEIEQFRFDDGTFTLAQLVAPTPGVVSLAAADVGRVREGDAPQVRQSGTLIFDIRRGGDLAAGGTVDFTLDAAPGSTLTSDDISTVAVGGNGVGAGLGGFQAVFQPGQALVSVFVIATGDRVPEPDEAVRLTLTGGAGVTLSPTGVVSATGTFANDDVYPELHLASATAGSVPEGNGPGAGGALSFDIVRSGDLSYASTVSFNLADGAGGTTSDDIATVVDGGNALGSGFGSHTITFAPGEASRTISVLATPDRVPEADEGVVVTLVGATLATVSASLPLSASGTFSNDDVYPLVRLVSASAGSVAEGNGPGDGGALIFGVERSGDLGLASTVWFSVADGAGGTSSDDVGTVVAGGIGLGTGFGLHALRFAPGEASHSVTVFAHGDMAPEGDEGIGLALVGAEQATLDPAGPLSATGTVLDDDAAWLPPLLTGPREALEGQPWALTITPQPAGLDASALQVRIDWGDGSAVQTLSGAALAAQGGVVAHTFTDDPDGPVNRRAGTVEVQVTDPASRQTVGSHASVDVVDVAPAMTGSFGYPSPFVEHHAAAALTLGALMDVAGDPVQQLFIDWGDGPPQPVPLQGPAVHSWAGLGHHEVAAFVVNDDGSFEVARTEVAVTATAGGAAPNGTPAQWAAAWTDSLMSFSHKADRADPLEAWTPVTLTAVNSGVLTGGDLYGGLLGVSGQSVRSNGVRQEIDGTEALRIALNAGERADSLIFDLARLFTNDAPGAHEAGVVQLYDGSTLVAAVEFHAGNTNGRLHVELLNQPAFDSVIFRAGTHDENAGGVFRPGGLVNSQGGYLPATATLGSDYLIESVQFLDLPEVGLTGVPASAGG